MIKTSISVIILFSIVTALVFLYFAEDLADGLCENKIYETYLSPDQSLKAVAFQRDCGGTDGATTQISILDANRNLENRAGNIFVIQGLPKDQVPTITWNSDQEVTIHYQTDGSEIKAETHWGADTPLKINYQ